MNHFNQHVTRNISNQNIRAPFSAFQFQQQLQSNVRFPLQLPLQNNPLIYTPVSRPIYYVNNIRLNAPQQIGTPNPISPLNHVQQQINNILQNSNPALTSENTPKAVQSNQEITDESQTKKRRKSKKSDRPCRGYLAEQEERQRRFTTVGQKKCYAKDYTGNNNVSGVSVTECLLELQHKFIQHRLQIDSHDSSDSSDLSESPEKTNLHESVPYNVTKLDTYCSCTDEEKKSGVHHDIFKGLKTHTKCKAYSNNANSLHHYRVVIRPETNFVTRDPTIIYYDGKDFCFEGYSIFSHEPLENIPPYCFMRNLIDYEVRLVRENYIPTGFCIKDLDLVCDYLFTDIFELYDWNLKKESTDENCSMFHLLPRFVHRVTDITGDSPQEMNEILSMSEVLEHLIESFKPFIQEDMKDYTAEEWKDFSKGAHGCIILHPKMRPRAIRVDGVSKPSDPSKKPMITHAAASVRKSSKVIRKEFNDLYDQLNKAKAAVKSRAIPRKEDQERLCRVQNQISELKEERETITKWIDVDLQSDGFMETGIRWDMFQHCSYLHGLLKHLKFMLSLPSFEENIAYKFKDRGLLKVALSHPSFLDQSSLTPSFFNSIQNVGKRHFHVEKKVRPASLGLKRRGILNLTNIMTTFLDDTVDENPTSYWSHNERLEFLGDAVLDYLCSLHLFLMFPHKTPGELTAARTGLVQGDTLLDVGKNLDLQHYFLMNHRNHESEHAGGYIANAVEAVLGAIYLDAGLEKIDEVLASWLFPDDEDLLRVWRNLKPHQLQKDHADGDRHLIAKSSSLQKLTALEKVVGVRFKHIRLLAKAFTHSVLGLDDKAITDGNYERLEFLGDAILKYVSSDYLYKHYPSHQEGHLTLLRSTLINASCLASCANELDFHKYIFFQSAKEAHVVKQKVLSDVFEAFLGAVHIDKGIRHCRKLLEICIFSRLRELIINQDWMHPKSQLSQCIDSLRGSKINSEERNQLFPVYKRLKQSCHNGISYFKVGVYLKGRRLGTGEGRSRKEAEKEAAKDALKNNYFEQYARQKRLIKRKLSENERAQAERDRQNPAKRRRVEGETTAENLLHSPEYIGRESDEGAETLESSEGESDNVNDGELYETVFSISTS